MKPSLLTFRARSARVVICLLCCFPISILAQSEKDSWRRVYTGDDSLIEVNASSLTFEAEHILRVTFRTILSKPESLNASPGTKYKTRLETFEFKSTERRYRFHQTQLLDSAGKTLQSYQATLAEDWRVMKEGGMMWKLFDAVRDLPPLGNWKVVAYRFGEGPPANAQEFSRLLGTRVSLYFDRADVGVKSCSSPAYQSEQVTNEEFSRKLGISLEAIGIKTNHADTIDVKCETNGWAPPQSLLVKLPEGGMLMLWNGVFLELKKERY